MRLSLASIVLASVLSVAADPHDAFAKRAHRNRALTVANATVAARIPHRIRFPGTHDPDETPDGLDYDEEDIIDDSLFADTYEEMDDKDVVPELDDYKSGNGTTEVVDEHELERRKTGWKKQGFGWTDELKGAAHLFKGKGTWGAYTWSSWIPDELRAAGIMVTPMLGRDKNRDTFKNSIKKACVGGSCWLMSLNEVNHKAQANISPGKACWVHRTYLTPLKNKYGYKIMSPSTANGPTAAPWMREFKKQCPDVWKTLSAINVHYYSTDYNKVIQWMKDWTKEFGLPVVLSENACHAFGGKTKCSQQQAITFQQKIAAYCNSTSKCITHMIFGSFAYSSRNGINTNNRLFNGKNSLSPLGKVWVNL